MSGDFPSAIIVYMGTITSAMTVYMGTVTSAMVVYMGTVTSAVSVYMGISPLWWLCVWGFPSCNDCVRRDFPFLMVVCIGISPF